MKLVLLILVILQLPVAALTEDDFKIDIHGYLSQGFLISNRNNIILDSKKGTFHFNELGLNFTTQLTDRIHIGIQFAARDLGDKGNDKIIICWAFADYNWHDWLGFRIGKMKLSGGLYNKTRDIDMLRTFILLPQSIYPENFRDTETAMKGIGLYGSVSPSFMGNFSYQASIGTNEVASDSSTIEYFESFSNFEINQCNVGRLLNGSILWETPLKGLRAQFTLTHVKLNCTGTLNKDIIIPLNFPPYKITLAWKGDNFTVKCPNYKIKVLSVEYTWNNLILAVEYLKRQQGLYINVIDRYKNDWLLTTEGYYISGTYRFSKQLEIGIYYSGYTVDLDRKIIPLPVYPNSDFQMNLCASMRFDLNSRWTFKIEGHLIKGAALCLPKNNLNDGGEPVFAKRWGLFGAKVTYTF